MASRRGYRRVANRSNVDETLFGNTGHNKRGAGRTKKPALPERDEVQLVTKDTVRRLRVPRPTSENRTIVLNGRDYERLLKSSRIRSEAEIAAEQDLIKTKRDGIEQASKSRKEQMKTMERERTKNKPMSDLDREAMAKSEYLLENAKMMMEEQEDEVKKLNELILQAKCHAIRDAQLKEKDVIAQELKEEESRLDQMMEIDRVKALDMYSTREEAAHRQRLEGAEEIKHQIKQREQQRLIDEELKDQETQAMLQYLEQLQEEDMIAMQKKREAAAKVMEEVAAVNAEALKIKERELEQLKLEDLKLVEYQKNKAAREEAEKERLEAIAREKELETARLRALQEQANDQIAEKHAIAARRQQDEAERSWRKQEAHKKKLKEEAELDLIEARRKQIQFQEHFKAVQAKQDYAEFQKVLDAQQAMIKAEEEKDKREHIRKILHKEDVIRQIKEKEALQIEQRKAFFDEGIKLDIEARERRKRLDNIKQRKFEELIAAGVEPQYLHQINRFVNTQTVEKLTH
eukprot:UC4_evm1s473